MSERDRDLTKHLSDMGFPLTRAARAVRELGGSDNKKIVEYLLAMQALEEEGIPEGEAEKALALADYDQSRAKDYYKNMGILRNLGFAEERASSALVESNMDRDKALDLLFT